MNSLIETLEAYLPELALLSWKGSLLALASGLLLLAFRRHLSPAWRHGLWLLVLIRFIVPDLGQSPLSLNRTADAPAHFRASPEVISGPVLLPELPPALATKSLPDEQVELVEVIPQPRSEPRVLLATVFSTPEKSPVQKLMQRLHLIWLVGACAVLGSMIFLHLRLLYRLRNGSEPPPDVAAVFGKTCLLAGIKTPRLIITDAVSTPSLCGILRPAVLLPRLTAVENDTAALKLIFLHELAHLRRRDLWTQLFSACILVLHWFNPAVWIISRSLRAEAEMAADARALRWVVPAQAQQFGQILLSLATRAVVTSWLAAQLSTGLLGMGDGKRGLKRRLEALRDIAHGRRTRWLSGLAAFTLLAITGLTRAPAEDKKPEPPSPPAVSPTPTPAADNTANHTRVFGKVVDAYGRPVAGADINLTINLLGSSGGGNKRTKTDAEGRFSFEKLTTMAEYLLFASHPDHAEASSVKVIGYKPDQERTIVLPQTLWVTGKVTNKRNGKPIEDARVFFAMERTQSSISRSFGRFDWKLPSIRTSKTGEYRLPVKVRDARQIVIRAWAPDMTSTAARITLEKAETSFDMQIEPELQVPGKVVNAANKPVQDAFVFVVEDAMRIDESELALTVENLRSKDRTKLVTCKMFVSTGYSKADGTVEVESAVPLLQPYQSMVAIHPEHGLARMPATELKAGFVFKLEPWATLHGIVTEKDGKPLANSEVSFTATAQPGDADKNPFILRQNLKTMTDDKGGFTLSRLAPHTLLDGFRAKGRIQLITAREISSGPQTGANLNLRDLNLPFTRTQPSGKNRGVRGRVVFPPGRSINSADYYTSISFRSLDGNTTPYARLQDDGSFVTAVEAPGFYELSFTAHAKPPKSYTSNTHRWMRFRVEPNAAGDFLELGEIRLEEKDFLPTPEATMASQPPDYAEGPEAVAEVILQTAEQVPVKEAKAEVRDFLDIHGNELGQTTLARQLPAFQTDSDGKARITFPRRPRPDMRVHGVQISILRSDGAPEEPAKLMDGRKNFIKLRKQVNLELRTTPAIISYTLSSSAGIQQPSQPIQGGLIRAALMLRNERAFILQGTTAEGQVLFSEVLELPEKVGDVFKADLKLQPGLEITGQVKETQSSTGFVIATSYIQGNQEQPGLQKGIPPAVSWASWAPVAADGSFRLPDMPHGRFITIGAMGHGWISRSNDISSYLGKRNDVMITDVPASGPMKITLSTQPCASRQLQVLLPDGQPGAGVLISSGYLRNASFLIKRPQPLHYRAEDATAYAAYEKTQWPFDQLTADAQGRVTLPNLPEGEINLYAYWPLPGTDFFQKDSPKVTLPAAPGKPLTVRLIGKP